jgi:hypothetical protein
VSLEADRGEVRLQERHDSSQTIVQMLGTIHAWLGAATIESVTVWLDDNRYTLAWQPAPAAGGQ